MTMKKILAILLAVAMLFCFAACGDSSDKDDDDDNSKNETSKVAVLELSEDTLQGKWEGFIPFEKTVEEEVEGDLFELVKEMDEDLHFYFEFTDDGVLKVSIDVEDTKDVMEEYFDAVIDYTVNGAAAEELGMTQEEFVAALEAQGMTLEDYEEGLRAQFDIDAQVEEMLEELQDEMEDEEKEYTIEDGKLVIDDEETVEVKITKNTLEIISVKAEDKDDSLFSEMEGLILKKV